MTTRPDKPVFLTLFFHGDLQVEKLSGSRSATCMINIANDSSSEIFTIKSMCDIFRVFMGDSVMSSVHNCIAAAIDACDEMRATDIVVYSNAPDFFDNTLSVLSAYRKAVIHGDGLSVYRLDALTRGWCSRIRDVKSVTVNRLDMNRLDLIFLKMIDAEAKNGRQ